jgi:hypothetical protein
MLGIYLGHDANLVAHGVHHDARHGGPAHRGGSSGMRTRKMRTATSGVRGHQAALDSGQTGNIEPCWHGDILEGQTAKGAEKPKVARREACVGLRENRVGQS